MTLLAALLKNFVGAYLLGVAVGMLFSALVKLIKGVTSAWD